MEVVAPPEGTSVASEAPAAPQKAPLIQASMPGGLATDNGAGTPAWKVAAAEAAKLGGVQQVEGKAAGGEKRGEGPSGWSRRVASNDVTAPSPQALTPAGQIACCDARRMWLLYIHPSKLHHTMCCGRWQ